MNPDKYIPLDDIAKGEGETFLIYGSAGTGKTWFAGTAGSRTLIINIGLGIKTLQSPLFKKSHDSNPIIVTIEEKLNSKGVYEDATMFDEICDTIDYALQTFPEKFDTVIVDDATALRKGALHKGLEINQLTNKSQTSKLIVAKHNIVIPAVQDYGVEMNLIEQFIAGYTTILKGAGKHFVLTAHVRETYRKGDKIGEIPTLYKVSPGFTGQTFPDAVPAYFDNVFYMEAVGGGSNVVYRATTSGDESRIAKTRNAGVFSPIEKNPNFLEMIQRIRSSNLLQKGK